jgi:asparagine synthase (glutamine-hydrolysing)
LCGITGVIGEGAKEEIVRRMCNTIRHRGPDDDGYLVRDGIALGMVRLSIIDLKTGKQPIHNEDSTIWIIYNGEIFNYRELRKELNGRHKFYTNSDTEVIVHLYEELGPRCLQKLNGMFAFAIWNERTGELLLARDRIGVKPLYYCETRGSFLFASEIKAILEFGVERELDPEALIDYLTLSYVLGDKTFFKGIRQLPAGHFLIVRNGRKMLEKYWDLEFGEPSSVTLEEAASKVHSAIEEAVRLRLVSDVPLGCHLSGGIDSSVVTCTASQILSERVKTFTGAFNEGPDFDETVYAKLASAFANTEYHEIRPDGRDLLQMLERLVWYMDYPEVGPGIYPQYKVCQLARENVKVILGGQGGDELFFGYPFILQLALEDYLRRPKKNLGIAYLVRLYHYLKLARRERQTFSYVRRLVKAVLKEGDLEPSRRLYRRLSFFSSDSLPNLLEGNYRVLASSYSPETEFVRVFSATRSEKFLDRTQYYYLKTYLHALLHVEDRTSMAVSLESRVPLCCDHNLVELVVSMPEKVKINGFEPKHLLRRAADGKVPHEILERKDKKGFPTPIGMLFRRYMKEIEEILTGERASSRRVLNTSYVKEILSKHASGSENHGMIIFMLLNLEFWFRNFIDSPKTTHEGYRPAHDLTSSSTSVSQA